MALDSKNSYQRMLTLWFALTVSVALYFVMVVVAAPAIRTEVPTQSESWLIVSLTMFGALLIATSFLVRRNFQKRAIEQQNVLLVQKGMIIACALCEISAMLGLIERFVFANRQYIWLFLLAGGGMLLHFPRPSQLEAASYKDRGTHF